MTAPTVEPTTANPSDMIPTLDELLASGNVEIEFDIVDPKVAKARGGKRAAKEAEFAKKAERFQPFVDKAFENPELTVTVKAAITDRPMARKLNDYFGKDFQGIEVLVTDEDGNPNQIGTDEDGGPFYETETKQLRLVVGTVKHGTAVVTITDEDEEGNVTTSEEEVPTFLLTFTATADAPKERKPREPKADADADSEEAPAKPATRRGRRKAADAAE